MKKYILDSNIYINFYERYYRFGVFPSFWDKFKEIMNDSIVLPKVVLEENVQDDNFRQWIKDNYLGDIINHKDYAENWADVINHLSNHDCYNDKVLTNDKSWTHENIADGWLIAIAKKENLVIVSDELRNYNLNKNHPTKSAKIPDIADDFKVRCIDMNAFFEEIGLVV